MLHSTSHSHSIRKDILSVHLLLPLAFEQVHAHPGHLFRTPQPSTMMPLKSITDSSPAFFVPDLNRT
jgi:hypothetical protein